MLGAPGIVYPVTPAEVVETVGPAWMLAARQQQRIDETLARDQRLAGAIELGIEEAEVEHCVVRDQRRIGDERDEVIDDFCEQRLVLEELDRETVDREGLGRHVALGIEIAMERLPARDAGGEPPTADLDQPMALVGIKARRFGVEHDLAHRLPSTSEKASETRHHVEDELIRFGIVATAARIARTCSRAASNPRDVSTTKSARRRFSASGICFARIASSFSTVMPGRSSTRTRCTSGGAETTTMASTRRSPPVSNNSGISSTVTFSPRCSASARRRRSSSCTSGWTIASSRLSAAASPRTRAASLARSTLPTPVALVTVVPGNAASIAATASPS